MHSLGPSAFLAGRVVMAAAWGGPRTVARPPEKGVFPLDHFAECKKIADSYLQCLKRHEGEAHPCHELSRLYLECRMDRKLMARQDLKELGVQTDASVAPDANLANVESKKAA